MREEYEHAMQVHMLAKRECSRAYQLYEHANRQLERADLQVEASRAAFQAVTTYHERLQANQGELGVRNRNIGRHLRGRTNREHGLATRGEFLMSWDQFENLHQFQQPTSRLRRRDYPSPEVEEHDLVHDRARNISDSDDDIEVIEIPVVPPEVIELSDSEDDIETVNVPEVPPSEQSDSEDMERPQHVNSGRASQ